MAGATPPPLAPWQALQSRSAMILPAAMSAVDGFAAGSLLSVHAASAITVSTIPSNRFFMEYLESEFVCNLYPASLLCRTTASVVTAQSADRFAAPLEHRVWCLPDPHLVHRHHPHESKGQAEHRAAGHRQVGERMKNLDHVPGTDVNQQGKERCAHGYVFDPERSHVGMAENRADDEEERDDAEQVDMRYADQREDIRSLVLIGYLLDVVVAAQTDQVRVAAVVAGGAALLDQRSDESVEGGAVRAL